MVLREPLRRVVLVVLAPLAAGFLLGMALGGVADLGVDGLHARAEGLEVRVLGELVVTVVAPSAALVAAGGAVVDLVVAVLLTGQAQGLQVLIGLGTGQAAQLVIAVVGLPQIAFDLGDVAGLVEH